jgi:tetratricopeptide (TPR) repeat protein
MGNLQELVRLLHEGRTRSKQMSYERRAPAVAAVPYLGQAREGLRQVIEAEPGNVEAWRLLSQAEELLLDYGNARLALEKALALDPRRDRGDLKRLSLLREREEWWRGLGLTPTQLAKLGDYLEGTLTSAPCNHMLCHTRAWLAQSGLVSAEQIMQAIKDRGGHCDCEVLSNVTL